MESVETKEQKNNNNLLKLVGILIVVFGFIAFLGQKTMNSEEKLSQVAVNRATDHYKGAVIVTNLGSFDITFLSDKAPNTVINFTKLAEKGFYENTKFHRVIKDFMIQGGDPLTKDNKNESIYGTGGPGYKFDDEISDVKLVKGIVAMANSGPNTNGSQFFVITAPETPWLQGEYTAFAVVVGGMDVVNKINKVETKEKDIPIEPVIIKKIELR